MQPQPYDSEKCNPLLASATQKYINERLMEHRQGIIDRYGTSKVPTPSGVSVMSDKKPSPPGFSDSVREQMNPKQEEDHQLQKAVIAFDDELS